MPPATTNDLPLKCILQVDTTYWGRSFAVVVFMDGATHRVLYHRFIERQEQLSDYRQGIEWLQIQGVEIQAIVADGLQGLKELFPDIPFQYCQFHQLQRIRQLLTTKPRLSASIELKALCSKLTKSHYEEFALELDEWHHKWVSFLSEKTHLPEGKWVYTHRRVRSAYQSLKRHRHLLIYLREVSAFIYPQDKQCYRIPQLNTEDEAEGTPRYLNQEKKSTNNSFINQLQPFRRKGLRGILSGVLTLKPEMKSYQFSRPARLIAVMNKDLSRYGITRVT